MKFYTWQDSCAVVACWKFHTYVVSYNEVHWKKFSIEFESQWKNHWWNGPQSYSMSCADVTIKVTPHKH